jgi:hypothetical protein
MHEREREKDRESMRKRRRNCEKQQAKMSVQHCMRAKIQALSNLIATDYHNDDDDEDDDEVCL